MTMEGGGRGTCTDSKPARGSFRPENMKADPSRESAVALPHWTCLVSVANSIIPRKLVNEFLKQTAQQRFWNMTAVGKLTLDLRTVIAILAIGFPDVQDAVKSWIVSKD